MKPTTPQEEERLYAQGMLNPNSELSKKKSTEQFIAAIKATLQLEKFIELFTRAIKEQIEQQRELEEEIKKHIEHAKKHLLELTHYLDSQHNLPHQTVSVFQNTHSILLKDINELKAAIDKDIEQLSLLIEFFSKAIQKLEEIYQKNIDKISSKINELLKKEIPNEDLKNLKINILLHLAPDIEKLRQKEISANEFILNAASVIDKGKKTFLDKLELKEGSLERINLESRLNLYVEGCKKAIRQDNDLLKMLAENNRIIDKQNYLKNNQAILSAHKNIHTRNSAELEKAAAAIHSNNPSPTITSALGKIQSKAGIEALITNGKAILEEATRAIEVHATNAARVSSEAIRTAESITENLGPKPIQMADNLASLTQDNIEESGSLFVKKFR